MAAELFRLHEMRADELAHNVAAGRHLEDTALVAFADQGVAAGQPLRAPHMRREERCHIVPRAVTPLDFICDGIDLPHLAVMQIARVSAVGKDEDVAVVQQLGVVLAAHFVILVSPDHLAGGRIDDKDHVQIFRADQNGSVGEREHGIGVAIAPAVGVQDPGNRIP